MNVKTFNEFSKKMAVIAKDCMVTKDEAEADPKHNSKLDLFYMKQPYFYNGKKLISHEEDLKEIIRMVPHFDANRFEKNKFISFRDMLPDTELKDPKISLKVCNLIEVFFGLSNSIALLLVEKHRVEGHAPGLAEISALYRKELTSNYKEEPSQDEK